MENFYGMVGPLAACVPVFTAIFMLPGGSGNKGYLKPSTWLYGTIMFYLALTIGSIRPDTWGWAIVLGSIAAGLSLIASWVGFYKIGKGS